MDSSSEARPLVKDPRTIARKYQLDLCKRAVEENTIVYLGTGCGKTHIAVLLMYELGQLIRKPSASVCVFLAPTVPLVRQQAMVIENFTDFKVRSYFGNRKHLKDHHEWNIEIEQVEVLVMTPQILLHNLRHCFIRMDFIALLVFDECHHAQGQKRHPYAQIMKEFYKIDAPRNPRIFGMTASPIIGKGGSTQLSYTKCINSLENLLDAKMCSVDNELELESFVASPDIKVYFYGPVEHTESSLISIYQRKLDQIKHKCMCELREKILDLKDRQKLIKLVLKMHDKVVFCLDNLGLYAAIQAVQILSTSEGSEFLEKKQDDDNRNTCLANQYLNSAHSVLSCNILDDNQASDSFSLDTLEEPFFSKKLSVLIGILSSSRLKENMKCIVFVKRIIVARTLACILGGLKTLDFWNCEFLVGFHSGLRNMSRSKVDKLLKSSDLER